MFRKYGQDFSASTLGRFLLSVLLILHAASFWGCNNDPAADPDVAKKVRSQQASPRAEGILGIQDQGPVGVIPASDLPALELSTKAIVAGVKSDFLKNLQTMQKVNENFITFSERNGKAWYFEINASSEIGASLTQFAAPFLPPESGDVLTIFNGGFWLSTEDFVATRSIVSPDKDNGVKTLHFTTTQHQNGGKTPVPLYYDDIRLIVTDDKTVSITERENDRIFTAEFPLPVDSATGRPFAFHAAGIGTQNDQYWFLSDQNVLLLKGQAGLFTWYSSKLQVRVNGKSASLVDIKLSMTIDMTDPLKPKTMGTVMAANTEGLFGQKTFALVGLDPSQSTTLRAEILPALKRVCVPCHTGMDQFQSIFSKKSQIISRLAATDATAMPPAMSPQLTEREESVLRSWLNRITTLE